jgi:hypothetical protein
MSRNNEESALSPSWQYRLYIIIINIIIIIIIIIIISIVVSVSNNVWGVVYEWCAQFLQCVHMGPRILRTDVATVGALMLIRSAFAAAADSVDVSEVE